MFYICISRSYSIWWSEYYAYLNFEPPISRYLRTCRWIKSAIKRIIARMTQFSSTPPERVVTESKINVQKISSSCLHKTAAVCILSKPTKFQKSDCIISRSENEKILNIEYQSLRDLEVQKESFCKVQKLVKALNLFTVIEACICPLSNMRALAIQKNTTRAKAIKTKQS